MFIWFVKVTWEMFVGTFNRNEFIASWAAQSQPPLQCPLDLLNAYYPSSVLDYSLSTFLVGGRDGGGFPLSHAAVLL